MEYTSEATTVTITATSRASCKIRDNYYTVEYSETRSIPDSNTVDINKERQLLWDTVNSECDGQIEEILKTFRK